MSIKDLVVHGLGYGICVCMVCEHGANRNITYGLVLVETLQLLVLPFFVVVLLYYWHPHLIIQRWNFLQGNSSHKKNLNLHLDLNQTKTFTMHKVWFWKKCLLILYEKHFKGAVYSRRCLCNLGAGFCKCPHNKRLYCNCLWWTGN